MLWRVLEANGGLPDEAVVCFANTGKEDEATLRFVRDCAINWQVPIAWVEYRSEKPHLAVVDFDSASRKGEPFEQLIRKRQYLPNPVARFCTQELKVLTIDRYLKSLGIKDQDMMVGVRADEPRRLPKLRARGLSVPLATAGVTQAEVQSFWKSQSFDLELEFRDGVTAQGNCDLCYLKGGHQIASMIAQQPERAVWWAKMERVVGATWRSDRPSYEQMLKFAQEQRDMFDPQEEAIACFCGD